MKKLKVWANSAYIVHCIKFRNENQVKSEKNSKFKTKPGHSELLNLGYNSLLEAFLVAGKLPGWGCYRGRWNLTIFP